ncbi:CLUMA_CG005955, isoform A [Clunio marinus]|uniref:CLUMA_CG005955, isoform A n=1 Tax=Clunio marinus TaxID=568069 RepID=A0A1J1HW91_9DIPT|nr:CLUMA_CG005955, isoform A [Clunio marinus]
MQTSKPAFETKTKIMTDENMSQMHHKCHKNSIKLSPTNKSDKFSVNYNLNQTVSSFPRCDNKISTSVKSVSSKVFAWNREKPRLDSEYVDKKFSKPFNTIAPELRVIGGLGKLKCVKKGKSNLFINRMTQVQKLSHTKTKLLHNFNLTEELRPIACHKKSKMKISDAIENVKYAENLLVSSPMTDEDNTRNVYNHQNPFNLDMDALSEFHNQSHQTKEIERRRNFQIIRRTMETKALTTVGAEKLMQESRNERFQLPQFFKVVDEKPESVESESSKTIPNTCRVVLTTDKPNNREIIQSHYNHKEHKLREKLKQKAIDDEKLAKEKEKVDEENRENFVFQMAEESLKTSECDENDNIRDEMKKISLPYQKFDYPVNESELLELKRQLNEKSLDVIKGEKLLGTNDGRRETGISCGQKIGSRVALRSFHDRLCDEPRGETNYYHSGTTKESSCLTHKQWLDGITNDPDIKQQPPRAKFLSTLKVKHNPNNKKFFLFDVKTKKPSIIVSPIQKHVEELNKKLKARLNENKPSNRSTIVGLCNPETKQFQRMRFMGIPCLQYKKHNDEHFKELVEKVSTMKLSTFQPRVVKSKTLTENIQLKPKVPEIISCDEAKEKEEEIDKFSYFTRAQPRGTDKRNLRIDKSAPWIEDELIAMKVKLENERDVEKTLNVESEVISSVSSNHSIEKIDTEVSGMKKSYKEVISSKLEAYKSQNKVGSNKTTEDNILVVEKNSSLSSIGTNFTNDSGSFLLEMDKKIPKSDINLKRKFKNRSLLTTKDEEKSLQPFTIPGIENYNIANELHKPKDRFHTHQTRSCANIRERIKIESPAYHDERIGNDLRKFPTRFATDIDESYQSEFYNERSRTVYKFKPKTYIRNLRETLRKNMEIQWMREKSIRDEVHRLENTKIYEDINKQIKEYEKLIEYKATESHQMLDKSMERMNELILSNRIKRQKHKEVTDKLEVIKTKNFQFLLKPIKWREQYDDFHMTPNGELEPVKTSIEQRSTAKLWDRNNNTFEVNEKYIEELNRIVTCLGEQKVFMEKRSKEMEKIASKVINKPLGDSFSSKKLRTYQALVDVLFKSIILKGGDATETKYYTSVEKFADIEKIYLQSLEVIDGFPSTLLSQVEKETRKAWKRKWKQAEHSYKIERNLYQSIDQLKKTLTKSSKTGKQKYKSQKSVDKFSEAKLSDKGHSDGSSNKKSCNVNIKMLSQSSSSSSKSLHK